MAREEVPVPYECFALEYETPWSTIRISSSKDCNAPDYGVCAGVMVRGFGEKNSSSKYR
jgi:hypothetical protein